jgi:hypothetical protein
VFASTSYMSIESKTESGPVNAFVGCLILDNITEVEKMSESTLRPMDCIRVRTVDRVLNI